MPIDLFIGLVTYPGTRFPDSRSTSGLLAQLERKCTALGLEVETAIVDGNLFDPTDLSLNASSIKASIEAELDAEGHWEQYLTGRITHLNRVKRAIRKFHRRTQFLGKNQTRGERMIQRLANIELAHIHLMKQAVNARASWALILEDDAATQDVASLARSFQAFLQREDPSPDFVSLSASFTPQQLGVQHRIQSETDWPSSTTPRRALVMKPAVTNTVCAVLYRGAFLRDLLSMLNQIPLSPIIPIDWKLNTALMRLQDSNRAATCWLIEPAPIEQRSMSIPATA